MLIESGLPGLDAGCIFRGRTAAKIAKLYLEQIQNRDPDGDEELNEIAKFEEHKLTPEQQEAYMEYMKAEVKRRYSFSAYILQENYYQIIQDCLVNP